MGRRKLGRVIGNALNISKVVFVIDTNIIVSMIVNPSFKDFYEETYVQRYSNFAISVVTEGELKAIASKRKWGGGKRQELARILELYTVLPIKVDSIVDTYAEIDTYSQGLLKSNPLPKGMSARNMGKNDLWIAATASVLQATLVTTDKDFDHLDKVYFPLHYIDIKHFK